jgi:hypothetical protein
MQPVVMLISARKTTERITSRLDHFDWDAPDVGGLTLIMREPEYQKRKEIRI